MNSSLLEPSRIVVSRTFAKQYEDLSPWVREQTRKRIRELRGHYVANPATPHRQARLLHGSSPSTYRLKLNAADRLIYRWDKRLILVEVGDHGVVDDFDNNLLKQHLRRLMPVPAHITRSFDVLREAHDPVTEEFDRSEALAEWIFVLSDEQSRVSHALLGDALRLAHKRRPSIHFVIGGPGTGKTCILATLADLLRSEALQVRIRVPEQVLEYLRACLPFDPRQFCARDAGGSAPRLLLVDDPDSLVEIERLAETATLARQQMLIVLFDPLQLSHDVKDTEYARIVKKYAITEHVLRTGYRQRRNVGLNAQQVAKVIAGSTPYGEATRVRTFKRAHSRLPALTNDVEFVNPRGYVRSYNGPTSAELVSELDRIKASRLWKHWPSLLIAVDETIDKRARALLARAGVTYKTQPGERMTCVVQESKSILFHQCNLADIDLIKGLEYQHAFLFLNQRLLWDLSEGFRASGREQYHQKRMMRIPFSRARDSTVVFAI